MKQMVVTREGREVISVLVEEGAFRIGRTEFNHLKLPDEKVSRHQCELLYDGDAWILKDRSGKGTKVDGKLREEATLMEDSVIEAGGYHMTMRDITQEEASAVTGVSSVVGAGTDVMTSSRAPEAETLSIVGKVEGKPVNKVIARPVLNIGSGYGNGLVIPGRFVSEFHARIYPKDDTFRIEDLDSTNGTKLDGVTVKDALIQPGQVLELGDIKLFIVAGGVDESFPGCYGIVSESPAMEEVFSLIGKVAPTKIIAFITGETGSGKGVVANAIHRLSDRSRKSLCKVNCASFQKNLAESELFGYAKGAFTGADSDRKGIFDAANEGTLFMDEIGEMSEKVQATLLNVLEDGEVKPVGSNFPHTVDVRLIVATHRDLVEMIKEGTFREDLYHRLQGVVLDVPPLRNRPTDIPVLARFFLKTMTIGVKRKVTISDAAMEKLKEHRYPGNVRELKQLIETAAVICDGDTIGPDDIRFSPASLEDTTSWSRVYRKGMSLKDVEKEAIIQALAVHDGNTKAAAKDLEISRSTLFDKKEKYGIK